MRSRVRAGATESENPGASSGRRQGARAQPRARPSRGSHPAPLGPLQNPPQRLRRRGKAHYSSPCILSSFSFLFFVYHVFVEQRKYVLKFILNVSCSEGFLTVAFTPSYQMPSPGPPPASERDACGLFLPQPDGVPRAR